MNDLLVKNLFSDLKKSIAGKYIEKYTYPWEILPDIKDIIIEIGRTLSPEEYENKGENIWISKEAEVATTAYLNGPLIICAGAQVRHCAFVRGAAIIGRNTVVGNSTDRKSVV